MPVLGHKLFGYIYPDPDGNGRLAPFMMSVLVASGGYPWTIIRVDDCADYPHALDRASLEIDLHPFVSVIANPGTFDR